ncbi:MAG: site-specific integrase [Acidobacteriota bacterium]
MDRLHGGPLGPYIDGFTAWLYEQGYKKATISYGLRLVRALGCWMQKRDIRVRSLDDKTTANFLMERRKERRIHLADKSKLDLFLRYLRHSHVIPLVAAVEDNSEKIRQVDVSGFVLRYTKKFSRARAKGIVTALRSFFTFLYLRGYISTDLAGIVPTVANWQCATLPNWISQEDVENLLRSCDQKTSQGQRNYTILLFLARLGLRSSEVVNMTLDDIDWDAGEIRVGGKSRRQDRMPLPIEVGEALTRYLCEGRPLCSTRRVFIRMKAPVRGLKGHGSIYPIVKRAFDRAGLHPSHKGPHTLRHSLATNMLRKGASLREIGEILRHRDLDTTQIYAKVDLETLNKIAQPWPGGEK